MNESAGKEMTIAEYFQQQYNIRQELLATCWTECGGAFEPAGLSCGKAQVEDVLTHHSVLQSSCSPPFRGSPNKNLSLAPWRCRLTNRSMPCVAVGNGKVILPPELCVIAPGQVGRPHMMGRVGQCFQK